MGDPVVDNAELTTQLLLPGMRSISLGISNMAVSLYVGLR